MGRSPPPRLPSFLLSSNSTVADPPPSPILPPPPPPPTAPPSKLSKPPLIGAGGFSQDGLLARRQILQAACDTLSNPASLADYNRGFVVDDDPDSTLTTHVTWDKVPGALCVLQEAGETEVVIQVGQKLLKERLPNNFKQDVLLVMALAYVDISRDAMTLNPPDFVWCCDLLGRALKLLQKEQATLHQIYRHRLMRHWRRLHLAMFLSF